MDDLVLSKLKENMNSEYANKFSIEALKEEKFIPINKQDDALLVGIVDADNREKRNSILTKIILKTKMKPKVVSLSEDYFNELIGTLESNPVSTAPTPLTVPPIKKPSISISSQKSSTPGKKKRLGEQLIEDGLITNEQLNLALTESKQSNTPIGSVLVKLGYITLEQLRESLSKQQSIAYVKEKDLKVDSSVIRLLPEDFIRDNKVVPISSNGKTIVIGMVNPNDKQALNDIINLTGLQPFPLILTHIEYEKCMDSFFQTKKETERIMEEISHEDDNIVVEENLWQQVERELQDDSNLVAKFASSIITEAINKKASDIHIEPRSNQYIIRYRIDGILRIAFEVPQKVEASLISRFKVIARMNIAEHRKPQDGHFTFKYENKPYDLRLNTLPVGEREKMVIRILQPDAQASNEDKRIQLRGATREDIKKIDLMTTTPHGIILTVGPTGSGKTSTLYSILNKLNNEMINITTVEDPVEIKLEGVNQVQVNPKAEITFASCMRSILRQDPDIIMVGEIRDYETLEASINSALTGHLVLSTVHSNSAIATITRLVEMGAPEHLISSTLVGVIAQRLIRTLCPYCKEPYVPSEEELKLILSMSDDFEEFKDRQIYKAQGCESCGNTGYVGRMGIYEILQMNREIKKMIYQKIAVHEIEDTAIGCGMKTLQRACLDVILNGETTIDEFIRVLGVVSE